MSLPKELPSGAWLTIRSLPHETTEEQLQEWLADCGIELPLDNIVVVKPHWKYAQAVVSLGNTHVADLFRRATLAHKFRGQTTEVTFRGKG